MKLPPTSVIVSQPHDFNIADLTGTDCPDSSAAPKFMTLRSPSAGA